ncbi:MAG: sporulation protein YqfD [Mycobacterium leprae]
MPMLRVLVAWVWGYLRIGVYGDQIERFLNLALKHGLYLWDTDRDAERMRAHLSIHDFRRLRPVARGAHCRVRILTRRGLPFKLTRLWRRPALIAGAFACLAFLLWATGHVWVVKVRISGPQLLDPRAVSAVAAEAGLRAGVWKRQVDVTRVQQYVQTRLWEASWVIVRLQGTRAVIEVVEKPGWGGSQEAFCVNLVARKPGVVEQVVPFQGEPTVKRGDVVKAGDVLVECAFRYWGGGRPLVVPGMPLPPRTETARTVTAQARVTARVAYAQYQEIPLVREVMTPTGKHQWQWVLNWKQKPIISWGGGRTSFARYQEERRTYTLGSWRNWGPLVELVIHNVAEVKPLQEQVSVASVVKQAEELLQNQLRWALGPGDKILVPVRAEVVVQERDYVGIRLTAQTEEEISAPQAGAPLPAVQVPSPASP